MEAKDIITKGGEPSIRVKPSEMRDALMVYFEHNQYDPIQCLIDIANGRDIVEVPDPEDPENTVKKTFVPSTELRVGIHKEFLKFLAPAMKVSDPDKGVEANFEVYIQNFVLQHEGVPKQQALEAKPAQTVDIPVTPTHEEAPSVNITNYEQDSTSV